ncbi:MAG: EAL domain-containing protein [Actinobacteria bacterium]|nr:EAL domain-containing protein [Actinomycetota bacterium]
MWQSALTRQLHDPELACQIRDILATRLAADNLVLDITETSLVDHLDFAIEDMRRLKKLGVRLAIDDFGAGYSSLSCLKRLPVDIVKIDRALIGGAAPIGHYPKPPLARCTRLRRDRMCDQGDQRHRHREPQRRSRQVPLCPGWGLRFQAGARPVRPARRYAGLYLNGRAGGGDLRR